MRTHLRPLVALALLSGCASTVPRSAANAFMPPDQEAQLAERIDAEVHAQLPIVKDPEIRGYVERIGRRVGAASEEERGPVELHFEVIDDPTQVNAFTTLGGNVYIFTGALLAARNEAEVAAILAHEVAHVANRDVARGLVARYGLQLLGQAALGNQPAMVTELAAQLGAAGAIAAHTREQERRADDAGVRYLAAAGYDPYAMITMFQHLRELAGSRPGAIEGFFATHPWAGDRQERLAADIARLGGGERGNLGATEHRRLQGQLRRYYASRGIKIG